MSSTRFFRKIRDRCPISNFLGFSRFLGRKGVVEKSQNCNRNPCPISGKKKIRDRFRASLDNDPNPGTGGSVSDII